MSPCHAKDESIHVIACCPMLSGPMYLPVRHDQVAKEIYRKLITPDENAKVPILDSYSTDNIDIWWDMKIKTPCVWCKAQQTGHYSVAKKRKKSAMSSILSLV